MKKDSQKRHQWLRMNPVTPEVERRLRDHPGSSVLRAPDKPIAPRRIIYLLFYSLFSSRLHREPFLSLFSIALLRRPTGVSPTGSLAPSPFVSALFVLACAIEETDSADLVPEFSHFRCSHENAALKARFRCSHPNATSNASR
jgi:hypothetical protein